jgi:hypothetical protein
MKNLPASASTSRWQRVVVYLVARLTRNRLTRSLVVLIQPALDHLDETEATMSRAERALTLARAYYDGADDDLDEVITQFEGQLYLHVGKNRKSTLYLKHFANGLVAVTGARIPDEIRLVKTLEGVIARELPDVTFATTLLPQIIAAREEMERQVPLYQAALSASANAWAAELAARHDIRRQYRIVSAELTKLFPESWRKVNTFFKDIGTIRREPATGDDETPDSEPVEPGPAGSTVE